MKTDFEALDADFLSPNHNPIKLRMDLNCFFH